MKNKQKKIRALLDKLDSSDFYTRSVVQQILMQLDNVNEEVENYELFKKNEFLRIVIGNEDQIAKILGVTREVIDEKVRENLFTNADVRFVLFYFVIYKGDINT